MIRLCNSGRLLGALTMQYLQHSGTTRVCETIGNHILHYGRRIPLEEWDARISVSIHLFWLEYLSMVGVSIVWPSTAAVTPGLLISYSDCLESTWLSCSHGCNCQNLWLRCSVSCVPVTGVSPSQIKERGHTLVLSGAT